MKAVILLLVLFSVPVSALELIVGGFSKHIGQSTYDYKGGKKKYNSTHENIGLGLTFSRHYLSLSKYKNSFYAKSNAISYGYHYKGLYVGATASTGYKKFHAANFGGLLIAPSIKYDLGYLSITSFGNAIALSFRAIL